MRRLISMLLAILCLAMAFCCPGVAEETPDEGWAAVVANPRVTDRLNLRAAPSVTAQTLGRFYSGTPVTVLDGAAAKTSDGQWAREYLTEYDKKRQKDAKI